MNLEEIIAGIRASRSLPSDDDLRRLPYKKAFVYGRVSTQAQVKESRESIKDIAKQAAKAIKDGYRSGLITENTEQWLGDIQRGTNVRRVLEDGDIIIDVQDLGLSGSLEGDKRPGLAHLERRVESGEIGAVYLTEGMSRLSRDRDRVLGYRLLKLLKQYNCRIRTIEGVYNPAIPRDWHHLAEDVDKSAEEMKTSNIRMGNRRAEKAAEGEHVGSPICPGYYVPIKDQNRDGSYIFGKWQIYPPHQEVVLEALEELVRQRSCHKTVQLLRARKVAFPFFPEELKYMRTRSALRFYHRDDTGYLITYNALMGLATNLRLVGIWQWRDVLIENNHEPAVPRELFEQAYEIAKSAKPKGRAVYAEPMEWAGLLYCYNHDEPRRLIALNRAQRWGCRSTTPLGWGNSCLQISDHFLTTPLTREFLRCLDLTPNAAAILEKLKSEASGRTIDDNQRRKREAELKAKIAGLQQYLGSQDKEREETYWKLINEEKAKLELLKKMPSGATPTFLDIEAVERFLGNIDKEWGRLPSRHRNRLLTLLVDRVELRHQGYRVEATIVWKTGLRQVIDIRRPTVPLGSAKLWHLEEDNLLKMLWPSSPKETIMAAIPKRTWAGIEKRASALELKRQAERTAIVKGVRWTKKEDARLKELYPHAASVKEVARDLERTELSVIKRAYVLKISRPKEISHWIGQPIWESRNVDVSQAASSPAARYHPGLRCSAR